MRPTLLSLTLLLSSSASAYEPFKPDLGLDKPLSPWPIWPEPDTRVPTGPQPHKVEWTIAGAANMRPFVLQVCQESYIRCEAVKPGDMDYGYRMYRRDNAAYLGTVDRNVQEEIQNDYARSVDIAEQHHPESAWIARKEAEKAQLEYVLAACTGGATYCTAMAAKMTRFKELFTAACSAWSGVCLTKVTQMKIDLQNRIDYVKSQCAAGDQQCFDAVTQGGEKQAIAQRQIEKSVQGGSGSRPPHTTAAGRPPFMPGSGTGDPMKWYSDECEHCKLYDGKAAEDY